MYPFNKMIKDVILLLEESGFSNMRDTYLKEINVDSRDIMINIFFKYDANPFCSKYVIRCCLGDLESDFADLFLIHINNVSFNLSIFKKLISNLDLICKEKIPIVESNKHCCIYTMLIETSYLYSYTCCGKYLSAEYYK